jgi:hypothetical protein
VYLCSQTQVSLTRNTCRLSKSFGFDVKFFILGILKKKAHHMLATARKQKPDNVGNIAVKYFSPQRKGYTSRSPYL